MRLAEFKLIDKTGGALNWKIVERIQQMVEQMPKNSMNYLSSTVAQTKFSAIVVDLDIKNRELTINKG